MIINKDHIVANNQFSKQQSVKTQILLAHTSSSLSDYFIKIANRWNGGYDASFTYTIGIDGTVYQHYNPTHYSNLFDKQVLDSKIISIGLENKGWLHQKSENGAYFDWKGDIYTGVVVGKSWRGYNKWAEYSPEQTEAMLELINMLIKDFNIKPKFSGNNLPLDRADEFEGVLNRSNYFKCYYDLSPAAQFEHISEHINKMPYGNT